MDSVTATRQITAAEFLAMPARTGAARRELIDGEIVVNQPTWRHNDAQIVIVEALLIWIRAADGRGRAGLPLDVELDDRNVHVPDVVWYRDGRVPALADEPPYPVPDLVVEVRSPSTWRYDIGAKKANYERHGAPELWLVDTAADAVLAFRRSSPDAAHFDISAELAVGGTLTSPQLPGFALPVGDIFRRTAGP